MKKILITYFSLTGNTKKMAEIIAGNILEDSKTKNRNDFEVLLKSCQETTKEDMLSADAIIIGTPTYYGLPTKEIIELITERVRPHGRLAGKIGAAFSSSFNIGGETKQR